MARLAANGWIGPIQQAAAQGIPTLGICLGMQLLADHGEENGEHEGLHLVPGRVRRLQPQRGERVPHVGWNEVAQRGRHSLFDDIPDRADFYFVHSYHFDAAPGAEVVASTPYCGEFVAVVRKENVWGTQFHPEKSSRLGLRLLRNFLANRVGNA
jgi:glutamine amidotransferase